MRQVEYVVSQVEKLEKNVKDFRENADHTLKDMLAEERKQNEELLIAYSKLKLKYYDLKKLLKTKNETQESEDGEIVLLKQEVRGKE